MEENEVFNQPGEGEKKDIVLGTNPPIKTGDIGMNYYVEIF